MTHLDLRLLSALRDAHAFATALFPESARPAEAGRWADVLARGLKRAEKERWKRQPAPMYVDRHCKHCGHKETIKSAVASYFGSEADFCTRCDRPWTGGKPYYKSTPAKRSGRKMGHGSVGARLTR